MNLIPIQYHRQNQGHGTILVPEAEYRSEVERLNADPAVTLRDPVRRAA